MTQLDNAVDPCTQLHAQPAHCLQNMYELKHMHFKLLRSSQLLLQPVSYTSTDTFVVYVHHFLFRFRPAHQRCRPIPCFPPVRLGQSFSCLALCPLLWFRPSLSSPAFSAPLNICTAVFLIAVYIRSISNNVLRPVDHDRTSSLRDPPTPRMSHVLCCRGTSYY